MDKVLNAIKIIYRELNNEFLATQPYIDLVFGDDLTGWDFKPVSFVPRHKF